VLKPQDILVVLKFISPDTAARQTYATLGGSLGLSASEAHAAVRRATHSGLLLADPARPESLPHMRPRTPALEELLCYGLRYFLPAEEGRLTIGIPTAESAPPLSAQLAGGSEPPRVWPHPRGTTRGIALKPIYPSAPDAALGDPILAEWLALADALRAETGRIAGLARDEVRARLRSFSHAAAA
jgi:hypothetical protein